MQNSALAGRIVTEDKTPDFAGWFLDLLGSVELAPGSVIEVALLKAITPLSSKLRLYKEAIKGDGSGVVRSRAELRSALQSAVTAVMALAKVPAGPSTKESFQERVIALLKTKPTFTCQGCGVACEDHQLVAGKAACGRCFASQTAACRDCHKRNWMDGMISVSVSRDVSGMICPSHITEGTPRTYRQCRHCGKYLTGPNPGNEIASGNDIAMNVGTLCHSCVYSVKKASCGHIIFGNGITVRSAISVEDDEGNDGAPQPQAPAKVICGKCNENWQKLKVPKHWARQVHEMPPNTTEDIKSDRRYGVEIEVCEAAKVGQLPAEIAKYWTAKADESLPAPYGLELASCVMRGDDGLRVVKSICDYAKENEWAVNYRAGLHAHLDLSTENIHSAAAVAMGYLLTYPAWIALVARSRGLSKYCTKHKMTPANALKVPDLAVVHGLGHEHPERRECRRKWLNWYCFGDYGTVEVRVHQGTLIYDKIAYWVKAHARFVDWCVALGDKAEVYSQLSTAKTPGELFGLISTFAWKDQTMSDWFRERVKSLHGRPIEEFDVKQAEKAAEDEDGDHFGDIAREMIRPTRVRRGGWVTDLGNTLARTAPPPPANEAREDDVFVARPTFRGRRVNLFTETPETNPPA